MMIANVEDARRLARRRMPKIFFDYVDGAAFSEQTARANVEDFDEWLLNQRVMVNVAERDISTTFLGVRRPLPFMLGPVGFSGLFAPHGEILAARAAHAAGIPFCLSNFGIASLEKLRAATTGPIWFQLYVQKDRSLAEAFMQRAERAGVEALCVTVDTTIGGVRERDNRNGFRNATHVTPRIAVGLLARPLWCLRMAMAGTPRIGNLSDRPEFGNKVLEQATRLGGQMDATLSWTDLARIRERWRGKLVIKGILNAEDALRAADCGADALVVSNHGGRQLDCAPSTISVLPEIVQAVGGRLDVLLDGGVRRGAQIVKAIALGAKGVLLGRAYAYALGAAGGEGVARVIRLLATEVDVTIGHMGMTKVSELAAASRVLLRRRGAALPPLAVPEAANMP
jgi:isopentenyl diphosphate isomerase/L-lactate dehydrogenase-like FMN-dependent dehydrogenase